MLEAGWLVRRARARERAARVPIMRTRALRLTIGAYPDGEYFVSVIEDEYRRVDRPNSNVIACKWTTSEHLHVIVDQAVEALMRMARDDAGRARATDPSRT